MVGESLRLPLLPADARQEKPRVVGHQVHDRPGQHLIGRAGQIERREPLERHLGILEPDLGQGLVLHDDRLAGTDRLFGLLLVLPRREGILVNLRTRASCHKAEEKNSA